MSEREKTPPQRATPWTPFDILNRVRGHAYTGHVVDVPLWSWPAELTPPKTFLANLMESTHGYLSLGGLHISGRHKAALTIRTVNVRRVVIGQVEGVGQALLGTIGPVGTDGRHQLVPELVVVPSERSWREQSCPGNSVFEITPDSLGAYVRRLRADETDPVEFDYYFYECTCCGLRTLREHPGSFEICAVCGWESEDSFCSGDLSPNHMTLEEAQALLAEKGSVKDWRLGNYRREYEEFSAHCASRLYAVTDGRGGWSSALADYISGEREPPTGDAIMVPLPW
jgi:hypothetical protein